MDSSLDHDSIQQDLNLKITSSPKQDPNNTNQQWIDRLREILKAELPEYSPNNKQSIFHDKFVFSQQQIKIHKSDMPPAQLLNNDSFEDNFLNIPEIINKQKQLLHQDLYEKIKNEINEDIIEEEDDDQSSESEYYVSEEDSPQLNIQSYQKKRQLLLSNQQQIIKKSESEFDQEYQRLKNAEKSVESLDVVEMNVFDRINTFDDFNAIRSIYKIIWIAQTVMCGRIIHNSWFESISLIVILFNCVILALDDPTTSSDDEHRQTTELVLLIFYSVEMFLKISSMGLIFNQGAYLRSMWNILDFLIIFTGFTPFISHFQSLNLNSARSLRVLRPLRTITTVKALKQILTTLISSLSLMKDAILILLFFYLLFAISGQQLFTGILKKRCFSQDSGLVYIPEGHSHIHSILLCSTDYDCMAHSEHGDHSLICGKGMENPNYGIENFDTFGWSLLNVYVIVTQQGWVPIMVHTQEAFAYYSFIYFIACILIGSLFLENLLMAIIQVKYEESEHTADQKPLAIQEVKSYNLEEFKRWGVYKSNKDRQKEKQENKFHRLSTFGEIAQLFKRTASLKGLFKSETNQLRTTPLGMDTIPQNLTEEQEFLKKQSQENILLQTKPALLNSIEDQGIPSEEGIMNGSNNQLHRSSAIRNTFTSKIGTNFSQISDLPNKLDIFLSAQPLYFNRQDVPRHSIRIKNYQQLSYTQNMYIPRIHPIRIAGQSTKRKNFSIDSKIIRKRIGSELPLDHLSQRSMLRIPPLNLDQNQLNQSKQILSSRKEINQSKISIKTGSKNKSPINKSQASLFLFPQPSQSSSKIQSSRNYLEDNHIQKSSSSSNKQQSSQKQSQFASKHSKLSLGTNSRKVRNFEANEQQVFKPAESEFNPTSEAVDSEDPDEFIKKVELNQRKSGNQGSEKPLADPISIKSLKKEPQVHRFFLEDIKREEDNEKIDKIIVPDKSKTFSIERGKNKQFSWNMQSNNFRRGSQISVRHGSPNSQFLRDSIVQQSRRKSKNLIKRNMSPSGFSSQHDEANNDHKKKLNELFGDEDFFEQPIGEKSNFAGSDVPQQQQSKIKNETTFKANEQTKSQAGNDKNSKNTVMNQVLSNDQGELYRRLFEKRQFVARVIYKEPENYIRDILPRESQQKKEKKKANMFEKINNLRYNINYVSEKLGKLRSQIENEKLQNRLERRSRMLVRQSSTMKSLLFPQQYCSSISILKPQNSISMHQQPNQMLSISSKVHPIKTQLQRKLSIISFMNNEKQNINNIPINNDPLIKLTEHNNNYQSPKKSNDNNNDRNIDTQSIGRVSDNEDQSQPKAMNSTEKPIVSSNFLSPTYVKQSTNKLQYKSQNSQSFRRSILSNTSKRDRKSFLGKTNIGDNQSTKMINTNVSTKKINQESNPAPRMSNSRFRKNKGNEYIYKWDIEKVREAIFSQKEEIKPETKISSLFKFPIILNESVYSSDLEQESNTSDQKEIPSTKHTSNFGESELNQSDIVSSDNMSDNSAGSYSSKLSSVSALSDELIKMTLEAESRSKKKDKYASNSGIETNQSSKMDFVEFQGQLIPADSYLSIPIAYEYKQVIKQLFQSIVKKGIRKIKESWSGDSVLSGKKIYKSPNSILSVLSSMNYSASTINQNEGGFFGIVQSARRSILNFTRLRLYDNFLFICIILNTVVLTFDGSLEQDDSQLDKFNVLFTQIFAADMVLKLLGMGLNEYASDKNNIFDAGVVSISLFDWLFLSPESPGESIFSITYELEILRAFRVLKIIRLLRQLSFMKLLIEFIGSIVEKVMYIFLLMLLYIFIYSLIGMQIFGGKFKSISSTNRMVFDSFFESCFTVFDLLTVEKWNLILAVALRTEVHPAITVTYLISCIFIGSFIIMNLVLATMIEAFSHSLFDLKKEEQTSRIQIIEDIDASETDTQSLNSSFINHSLSSHDWISQTKKQEESSPSKSYSKSFINKQQQQITQSISSELQKKVEQNQIDEVKQQEIQKPTSREQEQIYQNKVSEESSSKSEFNDQQSGNGSLQSGSNSQFRDLYLKQIHEQNQAELKKQGKIAVTVQFPLQASSNNKRSPFFDDIECENSLYIFSMKSKFRKNCYTLVKQKHFDKVIFIGVVLNLIKLISDTYFIANPTDLQKTISENLDIVFAIFFAAESGLKIISFGLVMDKNSYLRDDWQKLDLFIVIVSFLEIVYLGINQKVAKILKLLRAFLPLRLLNHNKAMKLIANTIIQSFNGLFNMMVVLFLIWLMFAILGVSLMKGKMNYCKFPEHKLDYDLYYYKEHQCDEIDGEWSTYHMNFENVVHGLLSLFVYSSFENWPIYSSEFLDATKEGPVYGGSSYFAIYICLFILVGSYFSIDLFGAVLAFHYDHERQKAKNKYLSDEQAQWIEMQRLILKSQPHFNSIQRPTNQYRLKAWMIAESSKLEIFIMSCIIGNIITMACAYETSSDRYDSVLSLINLVFSIVFICECILKMVAYGVKGYFYYTSNKFDFLVVVVSIVDIAFSYSGKELVKFISAGPQIARIFRVFRVTRLLRLIKQFEGLQKLLQTLIYALPTLFHVTGLLMINFVVFSIIACFLFSSIQSGNVLDTFQNFSTFHRSFLLLYQISSGEDWNEIMFDVVEHSNTWSALYFVVFIIIQEHIMNYLFVLIIIEQFEQNYINPENPLNDFKYSEEDFKKQWVVYSKDNEGIKIHERFITDFYFATLRPLGFDYKKKEKDFINQVKIMNPDVSASDLELICSKFRLKQKQLAEKNIMQMSIKCDYDGYIYYNELLYYFYKYSLFESVFERTDRAKDTLELEKSLKSDLILAKQERNTLKRLKFIKKKQQSLSSSKAAQTRQKEVNPMVRRMFVGMCFKTWMKYSSNLQNEIKRTNEQDDISSQTDSDGYEEDQMDDFNIKGLDQIQAIDNVYKNKEEENIIQVRKAIQRQAIIPREHTVYLRSTNKIISPNDPLQIQSNQDDFKLTRSKDLRRTSQRFDPKSNRFIIIPNVTDLYQAEFHEEDADFYQSRLQFESEKNIFLNNRQLSFMGISLPNQPRSRRNSQISMSTRKFNASDNIEFSTLKRKVRPSSNPKQYPLILLHPSANEESNERIPEQKAFQDEIKKHERLIPAESNSFAQNQQNRMLLSLPLANNLIAEPPIYKFFEMASISNSHTDPPPPSNY